MNKTLINVAIFAVGALVGSAASMQYFKNKYETQYREEINEVKAVLRKEKKQQKEEFDKAIKEKDQEIKDIDNAVSKKVATHIIDYCGYSKKEKEDTETAEVKEERKVNEPYVITPDEFGEIDDYETRSLLYWADEYITTNDYGHELITDLEDRVGYDCLNHFGEYEEDTVWVRNDFLKEDYEITKIRENYIDEYNRQKQEALKAQENDDNNYY